MVMIWNVFVLPVRMCLFCFCLLLFFATRIMQKSSAEIYMKQEGRVGVWNMENDFYL